MTIDEMIAYIVQTIMAGRSDLTDGKLREDYARNLSGAIFGIVVAAVKTERAGVISMLQAEAQKHTKAREGADTVDRVYHKIKAEGLEEVIALLRVGVDKME